MKKIIIISAIAALLLAGGIGAFLLLNNKPQTNGAQPATNQPVKEAFNKTLYSIDEPGSIWWVVNKQRPLPDTYEPGTLIAPNMKLRWAAHAESMQVSQQIAPALEQMYKASQTAGLDFMLISGFRSFATQKDLYEGFVRTQGQAEADRISAKPGTSEHQTGLVVDLGRADKTCELETCFGDTAEGKWLAAHAHEYGFIIRYPKGKEAIVGYQYEPWHVRYVGPELAAELTAKQQTMEEFFGL